MQRRRLNLVLAGAVVALGVAVYFSERKKAPGPPLTPNKADAVTKIVIEHPKSDKIQLERHESQWVLTAPVKADADGIEVTGVTGLADKETREKLDPAQVKLAELKLDPPEYSVTLNDTKILFGAVEPLEYRRYVKVGDAIYLIDDPPGTALDADYSDLVAKNLFPDKTVLQKIEVPGLTLSKGADGKWSATPADPRATPEVLAKITDGWVAARAMWNELAPKDKPPAGDPVTITVLSGGEQHFVIAARDPQFKLFRPDVGVTYVLSKALADELLKLPEPKKEEPTAEKAPQEPAKK